MNTIFNLPDLGEGLPDAEIHAWHVKEGQHVKIDEPLVSMETAKAVVDVPSPQDGIVIKCYGAIGEIIKTGQPLVAFQGDEQHASKDKGTVVGELKELKNAPPDEFKQHQGRARPRITPAMKLLAKKHGVDIQNLEGTGEHGIITREDIERAIPKSSSLASDFIPLKGTRRAMVSVMNQSHREVVPVSIFDEADIQEWSLNEDVTVRLILAISDAIQEEPSLNVWFDGEHVAVRRFDALNLGLAVDTVDGLFVPVIPNANKLAPPDLRKTINDYRLAIEERTISPELLKGATFTLSNFGKFSGRFANPIVVPPTVGILATGKIHEAPVVRAGHVEPHRLLPLSLSFDHRAVTGGEAARFLKAVISSLEKSVR